MTLPSTLPVVVGLLCGAGAGAAAAAMPSPAVAPAAAGESWLTPAIAAGAGWRGAVVVTNTAPVARRVRVYAVDAEVLPGGGFAPGARGEGRAVGRWFRPARRMLALDAGASVAVAVGARVPGRIRPGRYPGAIVAEPVQPAAAGPVTVVGRAGVRVYLTVAGDAPPRPAGRPRVGGGSR